MAEKNQTDTKSDPKYTPDLKQPGWPALSKHPYVGVDYYEMFDARVRPQQDAGSGTAALATPAQIKTIESEDLVFELVTAFNFSMRTHTISVPGPQLGTTIQVRLPPLGVIRAPRAALHVGVAAEGVRWPFMRLASPHGDCGGKRTIKDGAVAYESCDYVGCPRHPIPDADPSKLFGHAIIEAQRLLQSLGDPVRERYVDKDGKPQERISFTPPFKETAKLCMLLGKIDARGPVQIGISARVAALSEREARFEQIVARGGQAAGR